ncbi:MAG: sigma 54-interacting transcriptional regulator [Acidobacteriota bacterium]
MRPRLAAITGPLSAQVFELDEDLFTIGRLSSNQLQILHGSVSRHHCRLHCDADGVRVEDLDSLRGTFVNGIPIQRRRLEHGDYLKIGDSLFLFLVHRAEARGEPPSLPEPATESGEQTVEKVLEIEPHRATYLLPQTDFARHDPVAHNLSALLTFGIDLQTEHSGRAIARRLARLCLDTVPAEQATVLVIAEGELKPLAEQSREGSRAHPPSLTLCRQVVANGTAIWSDNVPADEALRDFESLDGSQIRAVLCVPLLAQGACLGILYADTSQQAETFCEDHLELLTAAGSIAALALHQSRQTERLRAENRRLRADQLDHDIVGESPALEEVLRLVERVAPSDLTVLVKGESGTGKELIAKALHRNSPRAEKPFVAINCATLSETLLESELFGHERGAFTGAVGRKAGHFEMAHGGTLFLDEVGEISVSLQARLLRALEEGEIQRVGGTRILPVDVRVVAATNRDLGQAIRQGIFREDLYHRLNVFSLDLPPLHDRGNDITLLARHFLARSAERLHRTPRGLAPAARDAMLAYSWPGNVRELRNAMERAAVLADGELVQLQDLPEAVVESAPESGPAASSYHAAVVEAKRRILQQAIRRAEGNHRKAAELLDLNRTYLQRLIRNLGLGS